MSRSLLHSNLYIARNRYIVLADKAVKRGHLDTMMAGVEIDGVRVAPVEVSVLEDSCKMRVIISDGKKHEVRNCEV